MTQQQPRRQRLSDDYARRPQPHDARQNTMLIVGMWIATVLAYLAQPIGALIWSGIAIAGAIIFLTQARPRRPPVIAALVFAGVALLWTLVRLGTLY
jgi:hypothetical protein